MVGNLFVACIVSQTFPIGKGIRAVIALEHAERNWPDQPIYLSAQAHLQGYYSRYGFNPVGDVYVEDGIPHLGMRRDLD